MKKEYKWLSCLCLTGVIWVFASFAGLSSLPISGRSDTCVTGSRMPIASASPDFVVPALPSSMPSVTSHRKQFALLMSLKPDSVLAARYKAYHQHVWPGVEQAFRKAGILDFKIFLFGYQTFLLVETTSSFNGDTDFDKISGPVTDQWDKLMSNFQQLSGHEKWMPVELIYHMQ